MSPGRVLVFEDDPGVGALIRFVAESMGLDARCISTSGEFFEAVNDWAPTIIAIDLLMPDMDGVQVIGALADRGCRARIIITGGLGSRVLDAARRSAVEHGLHVLGALSKPFLIDTLQLLIKSGTEPVPILALCPPAPSPDFEITEATLRSALEKREFHAVYQPRIECASRKVAGFEALARWRHPDFGTVMPDRFIPIAEKLGMIDAVTEQVVGEAMDWLSAELGTSHLTLSVNLSAKSLGHSRLLDWILARCRDLALAPARLIFEITETAAMENPGTALDVLTRLRMRGFHLSIDDFGSGYSSMLQLVRLPFSEMKVNRFFVMAVAKSAEARAVIKSIVNLGRSLGLKTAAEGVEDAGTLDFMRSLGCDLAQGYFIAHPMPGDEVAAWLASWKPGIACPDNDLRPRIVRP